MYHSFINNVACRDMLIRQQVDSNGCFLLITFIRHPILCFISKLLTEVVINLII